MSKLKVDQLEEVTGGANVTVSAGSDLIVDDNLYVVGDITGSGHISGSSSSTGSFGRVETGNLTVGGSQGSDGEVLTSTGTGVAWEAAGGGVDGIVSTADATAITIDSSENTTFSGDVLPSSHNSKDLGSDSVRWANLYVADAHYSNVGTGGNDVDGTEGSWTIQEGDENLFLINRETGKKFKFKLQEIE